MPTDAGYVGPLDLPLPAGSAGAEIDDPVVSAILDLLGFVTKDALDARLANVSGAPTDACPDDGNHRFAFDPFEERANHVKRPVPSLFVWHHGGSKLWQPYMLQHGRERMIRAMYIYPELPKEVALNERRGLFDVVEAAWMKASDNDGHLKWSYNGTATGTPLSNSWGAVPTMEWEWQGGEGIQRVGIDEQRGAGRRRTARTFPAYVAVFRVRELNQRRTYTDPDDVTRESTVTIAPNEVPFFERYAMPPDGSEDL